MKYIVLKRTLAGCEQRIPIIFPNELVHKHVAGIFIKFLGREYGFAEEVVSAGEFNSFGMDIEPYGGSTTLGLTVGIGDAQLIKMNDYLKGLV
ncbi:MAG TPA: hypothetical protein VIY48_06435 [Candidatus Paceibacterota bacterium]